MARSKTRIKLFSSYKDRFGFLNVTEKTSKSSRPWPQGLNAKKGYFFMPL